MNSKIVSSGGFIGAPPPSSRACSSAPEPLAPIGFSDGFVGNSPIARASGGVFGMGKPNADAGNGVRVEWAGGITVFERGFRRSVMDKRLFFSQSNDLRRVLLIQVDDACVYLDHLTGAS